MATAPNQAKALSEKKYEFAVKKHLPPVSSAAAAQSNSNNNNYASASASGSSSFGGVTAVAARRAFQENTTINANTGIPVAVPIKSPVVEPDSYLISSIRSKKETSQTYFGTSLGNGHSSSVNALDTLLDSNMTYQNHLLQRERQLAQYVKSLEQEDVDIAQAKQQVRMHSLQQAHVVDRVKLHQSARNRLALQQRSKQQIPSVLLEKYGLSGEDTHRELQAAHTKHSDQLKATREVPRLAHIEYNLPRLVETALNRQERLDAHRTRIAQRVSLEERVKTDYASQRMKEHHRIQNAKSAEGVDAGVTILEAARRPGRADIRDAKELEKKHKLNQEVEEKEKKQIWAEMQAIDKQTSVDAKKARIARGKRKSKFVDDDDSD